MKNSQITIVRDPLFEGFELFIWHNVYLPIYGCIYYKSPSKELPKYIYQYIDKYTLFHINGSEA